ncbi:MAG: O-antigen ligase family protein [Candidatus Pacebacteria bacterium]|nr:O-antigen ligase family protein [Candidatus Paceibacterota bacterium]
MKSVTKFLLLSVIAITPFLKASSLYFPYVSGKIYVFRLLVMLAFFFWVWLILKERECPSTSLGASRPNFKNILVIALVLFFIAQIFVSFFGVDPAYSFFSSIERGEGVLQYGFWLLYFLMLVSLFKKEQDWKMFFSVFVAVAFLLSCYSWLNHSIQGQLQGVFGNPAYFAAFLIFAIGFSLIVAERKFFESRFINNLFIAAAGFFVLTLIFTQIRGAYAGLAAGIFLFCLLSVLFLRGENKKVAVLCAISLLIGLSSIALLFSAKESDFVKSKPLLSRVTAVTDIWETGSTRERLLTWEIALKAFQEKPVFGYGPENFGAASNKYYDYRIGRGETWFDRAHNNVFEVLATGGIVLFSFYLFWLIVTAYLIFKIYREKKILSFLLASLFLAYFVQGLFLFDVFAAYLGLFPFLAFLVFKCSFSKEDLPERNSGKRNVPLFVLVLAGIFAFFAIFTTCFLPYKANAALLKFYNLTENGLYKEAKPFLEKSFEVQSPYTFWEVRKRGGWQFLKVLDYEVDKTTSPADLQTVKDIYDLTVPELERFAENRPSEQQIYYLLGRLYRLGSEKLDRDDSEKAVAILEKGFAHSDLRVEYFSELAQVLISQGKFEQGEKLIKDYVDRTHFQDYFPYLTLGHFYFVADKYELAMEQYEKAREVGYDFCEIEAEYSRYMVVAEELKEYQKIVDMAKRYLEERGPDADTYFNVAVGYFSLEEKEKAKEFFLKALELDSEYESYRAIFIH